MKQEIINKSTELFLNLGFKSVTMDDIANTMGISKKTIYAHFKNKNELVDATTLHLFLVISKEIDAVCDLQKNPVEEIYEIKKVVMNHLKNEKSSPQFQLQKYYPKTFKSLKDKQYQMMQTCVTDNLNRGVASGIYRDTIDVSFIAKLYFHSLIAVRDNDLFPLKNTSMQYLLEQFLEYHLRGICTEKGITFLNQLLTENHITN